MFKPESLDFLIRSLGLRKVDIAKEVGTTVQNISMICTGEHNPSFGLADRIDGFLKHTWQKRRGETIPPEVKKIVFEMLFPPSPFDPFESQKRRRKEPNAGVGIQSQEPAPATAQTEAARRTNSANGEAKHGANGTGNSEGTGVSDSGTGAGRVPPGGDEFQGGVPQGPGRSGALDSAASTPPGGADRGPATQAGPAYFESYGDAKRAYSELIRDRRPGARSRRREFCQAVRNCLIQFVSKDDSEIIRAFRRDTGRKIRRRGKDPEIQAKRRRMFEIFAGAVASMRKKVTHSKGAYDEHTAISRRQTISKVLENPQILTALQTEFGSLPSVEYALGLYSEFVGRVDSIAECDRHITKLIGWQAPWVGYAIVADFTGLDVRVDRHHNAVPVGQQNNRRGFQKLWLGNAVDSLSAKNWIYPHFADNETTGWPGFIEWLYLEVLKYGPPCLIVDRISGVFAKLLDLKADEKNLEISPAVALVLLAGTWPHVHQGGRATGGAHVEISNRITKDEARGLLVRRALLKELSGHGLVSDVKRMTQLEFTAMLQELQTRMDQRILARAGDSRINLWNDQEGAIQRSELALADDAAERWRSMAEQIKVGMAHHNTFTTRDGGEKFVAEIEYPEPMTADDIVPSRVSGMAALLVPCGLRKIDDPEAKRLLLVEPTNGQPRLHLVRAKVCARNRFGLERRRPVIGHGHIAKPDNELDHFARERDKQAKAHEQRARALKQGTTDEPIESNDATQMRRIDD
jgi:hypothetical protein